jgi:AcrR family transcriptional regulator
MVPATTRGKRAKRGRPRNDERPPGAPSTRERILAAAGELFAERGFAQTSLSKIAEAADVTTGAIYGHFDSKGALLVAVVEQALVALPVWQLLGSDTDQPSDEPTASLYGRLAALYARPELSRVRRLAIEVHAAAARDKEIAALVAESNGEVVAAVRRKLKGGASQRETGSPDDVDHAARFLLVVIMGLAHLETLDPGLVGNPGWDAWLSERLPRLLG